MLIDIQMIKKKSPRLCRASDLDKSSGATRIICNKMIIPLAPNTDNTKFRRKKQ